MRVPRRRLPVLPLIEEQPGLLAAPQIDVVLDRPFAHDDRVGNAAVQHLDRLRQSFERPHLRIVPRQDAGRLEQLHAACRVTAGQQAIHALRQRLHHQIVAVSIDDERRQQVRFAVNQPVGVGVEPQRLAVAERLLETARARAARPAAPRRASASVIANLRPVAEQAHSRACAAAARAPARCRRPQPRRPRRPRGRSTDARGARAARRGRRWSRSDECRVASSLALFSLRSTVAVYGSNQLCFHSRRRPKP